MVDIKKGASILIFTLWIVGILAIFALGLAFTSRLEVKSTSFEIDDIKAEYILKGIARLLLVQLDREEFIDELKTNLGDYQDFGPGRYKIESIIDEESKFNINSSDYDEIIKTIFVEDITDRIIALREFQNLESLLLVDGINEDTEDLENFTVYGDGKVNFNTAGYNNILEKFKFLPSLKIEKLSQKVCNDINAAFTFTCCVDKKENEDMLKDARDDFFRAIKQVKEFSEKIANTTELITKVNDIIDKTQFIDILEDKLEICCLNNYTEPDKNTFCSSQSESKAEEIIDKLFDDYLLNELLKHIKFDSYIYRVQITADVNRVKKSVTAVLDIKEDIIKYWYLHYYDEDIE